MSDTKIKNYGTNSNKAWTDECEKNLEDNKKHKWVAAPKGYRSITDYTCSFCGAKASWDSSD